MTGPSKISTILELALSAITLVATVLSCAFLERMVDDQGLVWTVFSYYARLIVYGLAAVSGCWVVVLLHRKACAEAARCMMAAALCALSLLVLALLTQMARHLIKLTEGT